MTPERWRQVKDALAAALARPESERDEYLRELRAADPDVAGEVASLLDHDAEGFLEEPVAPVPMLRPGTTFGTYLLRSTLGEGGMGVVYLAEDSELERPVALKFLSTQLERQEDARRRFIREAKAAAALDHPYICKIYQTGELNGRPFIAMEYVRGETLRARLDSGQMSIKDALWIAVEVTEALETAHAAHIVHRDLKPSNIMLTTDGHLKVLDFGLAKRVGGDSTDNASTTHALTDTGTVRGTVAYMSPEQVRGREVDLRSDLFSLGVVMYECVIGRNPFIAGTSLETASQILHFAPSPPAQVRADLPVELDRIVQRLLAKSPDDRYGTAADLRHDLVRLREGLERGEAALGPVATAEPPPQSTLLSRRAAVAALATASIAVPAAAWWWARRAPAAVSSRSVAVTPFANLSGEAENDYLTTGIPRALTTRLQRAGLRVIPWETASRFPDSSTAVEVARALNVSAVLKGSVQTSRGHVVVNVSLVDGTTGFLAWGEEFEQNEDLFDVQTKIATGVATALGHPLTADAAATLARPESSSKDAYDFYLQGASYLNDGDRESVNLAFDYFTRAVSIDPNLVEARVGLGAVYLERFWSGWGGGAGNLDLAAVQFENAIARDRKDMRARRGQMLIEFYRGNGETALRLAQEAARVGGDDAETLLALSEAYALNGPSDLAPPLLDRVLALDPRNQTAMWLQAITFYRTDRFKETITVAADYAQRFDDDPFVAVLGASALERLNDVNGARRRMEHTVERLMQPGIDVGTVSAYDFTALLGAGSFEEIAGRPERAQTLWRQGLQLTREALAAAGDSVGIRVFFVTFLGFTGDRRAFATEAASLLAALESARLNAWELTYMTGAYVHMGDPRAAMTLLRTILSRGRCVGKAWMTFLTPSWRNDSGLRELYREHDAEEDRRRRRYRIA